VIKTPFGSAEANRAGLMRLVIGILLAIMGANYAAQGRWLAAVANFAFALLAGMLAYRTLPGRAPIPRQVILGTLAVGVALWLASLAYPGA
jgi:hypothetical protein